MFNVYLSYQYNIFCRIEVRPNYDLLRIIFFVIKYEFTEIGLFLQNSGFVNFSKVGYSLLENIEFRLCYFPVTTNFLCTAINFNLRIVVVVVVAGQTIWPISSN